MIVYCLLNLRSYADVQSSYKYFQVFRNEVSTQYIVYSTIRKYCAPPSHSSQRPIAARGVSYALPSTDQLILPLWHQFDMAKSPLPNHKLSPPLIANFLYSSFRGILILSSSENKNDWHLKSSWYFYSFENILGEYPPKILFLQDSAIKTIGPLILVACSLRVEKLLAVAVKRE